MNEMRAALNEFLAESHENLDRLDRDLLAIEADVGDREALDRIFRTFHNLKGTCGFFELPRLGSLAHAGENLLDRLRKGVLSWRSEVTTSLLALADAVRDHLAEINASGSETRQDHHDLIERLGQIQNSFHPHSLPGEVVEGSSDHSGGREGAIQRSLPQGESRDEISTTTAREPGRAQVRVDVALLDRLMDLVGELVLTRNQFLQHSTNHPDAPMARDAHRLDQVTSALQDGVMKTRLRPIGTLWDRVPRVVRDLAIACGKHVRVATEGSSTELDRTVIEAIKDPIIHLIRNAVDHGIERPETRETLGKAELGTITLRATHQAGLVHVEISDDGSGIDPARVARKALKVGLINAEQAERMGSSESTRLIFEPGFSTAETITEVSGRGVGLDVVRANIEAIGGVIEVRSRPGQGTTFTLKVPLTLAIIPTLIVASASGERYALPQASLVELIRVDGESTRKMVETNGSAVFLRSRGEILPVVDLDHALGSPCLVDLVDREGFNLVVLQAQSRRFGLVVDQICDTEEIVVKPLGRPLRGIPHFNGATILGDGRIALILDVAGIARMLGLATSRDGQATATRPSEVAATPDNRRSFLILEVDGGRRLAVPLAEVSRLVEVAASNVETLDGVDMIAYQGGPLPLVRPGAGSPPWSLIKTDSIQVVICGENARPIGLVVDAILDVVKADPQVEPIFEAHGILGSALFGERVADLVDVAALSRETARVGGVGP